MPRHQMTAEEFNAMWAMIGAVILIPSAMMWLRRRLDRQSIRDAWREADQRGRVRAREERRPH